MFSARRLSEVSIRTRSTRSISMASSIPPVVEMDLHFLEPPHTHDPGSVSVIATLPESTLEQIAVEVQEILFDLQEATSITWASCERLSHLFEERFARVVLNDNEDADDAEEEEEEPIFSESSFFNFQNCLRAEQEYLLHEAFPDWRYKASLAKSALQPYVHLPLTADTRTMRRACPRTMAVWFDTLQSTVDSWLARARQITIPEFEDVVDEYNYRRHRRQQQPREHERFLRTLPGGGTCTDDTAECSPIETPLESENAAATIIVRPDLYSELVDLKVQAALREEAVVIVSPLSTPPTMPTTKYDPASSNWLPHANLGSQPSVRKDSGIVLEMDKLGASTKPVLI